jgi:hypothetical protein
MENEASSRNISLASRGRFRAPQESGQIAQLGVTFNVFVEEDFKSKKKEKISMPTF